VLFRSRRPDGVAINTRFETFGMAVRPGETQRSDEVRTPLPGRARAALNQKRLNAIHRAAKISSGSGPAGRMNAGLSVEGIDAKTRIVREGRQPCRLCGGERLDA